MERTNHIIGEWVWTILASIRVNVILPHEFIGIFSGCHTGSHCKIEDQIISGIFSWRHYLVGKITIVSVVGSSSLFNFHLTFIFGSGQWSKLEPYLWCWDIFWTGDLHRTNRAWISRCVFVGQGWGECIDLLAFKYWLSVCLEQYITSNKCTMSGYWFLCWFLNRSRPFSLQLIGILI